MAIKRLTETGITKITPPSVGRIDINDAVTQGLNLRVTARGVKSWCFAYRYGGKQKRMTIGRYPDISLTKAREIVRDGRANLALGDDPCTLRDNKIVAVQLQQEAQITVRELSIQFIEKHAKPNTKRWKNTQSCFDNHILPAFGNKPVKDIKRKEVINLMDKLKDSPHPSAANHVLIALRKMYSWSIERDELEFNPCNNIKKPVPIKERERVLTKKEISNFWEVCNKIGYPYARQFFYQEHSLDIFIRFLNDLYQLQVLLMQFGLF